MTNTNLDAVMLVVCLVCGLIVAAFAYSSDYAGGSMTVAQFERSR